MKKICLIVVSLIILVAFLFIPLLPCVNINLWNFYTLMVAIYTLIATIMVSFVVYQSQKKDLGLAEKQRAKQAKSILLAELEPSIRSIIKKEQGVLYVGGNIQELFNQYALELHDSLNQKQYRHLSTLVHYIDQMLKGKIGYDDDGVDLIVRSWVAPIFKCGYGQLYDSIENEEMLLNEETLDLLIALGSKRNQYKPDVFSIKDKSGKDILIYVPKIKQYIIYENEEKIFEGTIGYNDIFDEYDIEEGFKKGKEYVGRYKDFEFHGDGCKFDEFGNKILEGIFSKGELIQGTEYGCLYADNGENEDDYIHQIGDLLSMGYSLIETSIKQYGSDKLYVVDRVVYGDKIKELKSRTPLIEYLKKNSDMFYELLKDVAKETEEE